MASLWRKSRKRVRHTRWLQSVTLGLAVCGIVLAGPVQAAPDKDHTPAAPGAAGERREQRQGRLAMYAPGEVVFKVREGAAGQTAAGRQEVAARLEEIRSRVQGRHGLHLALGLMRGAETMPERGIYRGQFAEERSVEEVVRNLAADLEVEWAEPNYPDFRDSAP